MEIYNYDEAGFFLSVGEADESPLEEGVFLIPARATTVAPPAMQAGYLLKFDGDEWGYLPVTEPEIEPTPEPVVTVAMLEAECDRRLALGFEYDFEDERGVHRIGTTEKDLKGWNEVTKVAQAGINIGMGNTLTIDIETDTAEASVTAIEWQHILLAAGQVRQPIFKAFFTLKALDPIPADYADDSYWP